IVRDADGVPNIFVLDNQQALHQLVQDPETSDWNAVEVQVDLPGASNIEDYTSYSTAIRFYDANGVLVPQPVVRITSPASMVLRINGQVITLAADIPWEGQTDGSGLLMLVGETETLGTVPISVWADVMGNDDPITIDPSVPINSTLSETG